MKYHLYIDTDSKVPPTRDLPTGKTLPENLPDAKEVKFHPSASKESGSGIGARKGNENGNASLFFVGTATCLLEWEGIRVMTDPNFLHSSDGHIHLGPGVTAQRLTDPAVDLHDLPNVDLVLLSHYHADHFDRKVEASLRRDLPIITTPHAKHHLTSKDDESFTKVFDLDVFEDLLVNIDSKTTATISADGGSRKQPKIKVIGTPGKHVPDGIIGKANDFVGAVPPTNGWLVELGYGDTTKTTTTSFNDNDDFECNYRIYVSGDTLYVRDLERIPEYLQSRHPPQQQKQQQQNKSTPSKEDNGSIDLLLIHLGGTTIPSPSLPLLMVTMDAKQGVQLLKLVRPDVTIPIHYDDYDLFLSPLKDFKDEITKAGLDEKVVYLGRGDRYSFSI